jgi:hypothetical protein
MKYLVLFFLVIFPAASTNYFTYQIAYEHAYKKAIGFKVHEYPYGSDAEVKKHYILDMGKCISEQVKLMHKVEQLGGKP